jgi:Leucine-rich repeat (LRR) protein
MQKRDRSPEARKARLLISSFERRFGEGHVQLAMHAALPLVLTPDLLYLIRENFTTDRQGQPLDIPWVAVADLLLAPLCQAEGSGETYRMPVKVRAELLSRLQNSLQFGPERLEAIAELLAAFLKPLQESPNPQLRRLAQNQQRNVQVHLQPQQLGKELAQELARSVERQDATEALRLKQLIDTLPVLPAEIAQLQQYAKGYDHQVRGEQQAAREALQELPGLEVASVKLPELQVEPLEQQQASSEVPSEEAEETASATLPRTGPAYKAFMDVPALAEVQQQLLEVSEGLNGREPSDEPYFVMFLGNGGMGRHVAAQSWGRWLVEAGLLSKEAFVEMDAEVLPQQKAPPQQSVRQAVQEAQGGIVYVKKAWDLLGYWDEFRKGIDQGRRPRLRKKGLPSPPSPLLVILVDHRQELLELNGRFEKGACPLVAFPDYTAENIYDVFLYWSRMREMQLSPEVAEGYRKIVQAAFEQSKKSRNSFLALSLLKALQLRHEARCEKAGLSPWEEAVRLADVPDKWIGLLKEEAPPEARVLFLAFETAYESEAPRLESVMDEANEIEENLKRRLGSGLTFDGYPEPYLEQWPELLSKVKPDVPGILHMAGYEEALKSERFYYEEVAGRMADRFDGKAPFLLLFINTCHSFELTEAFLKAGIPAVIAVDGKVTDHAATRFSHHFYREMGIGSPLHAAFQAAERQWPYLGGQRGDLHRAMAPAEEAPEPAVFPYRISYRSTSSEDAYWSLLPVARSERIAAKLAFCQEWQEAVLDLSGLDLAELPPDLVNNPRNFAALEVLFLENNQLSSLPEQLADFPRLRRIHIHGNPLSELPEALRHLGGEPKQENASVWEEVRKNIANGQFDRAIRLLEESPAAQGRQEWQDELLLLKARFARLEQEQAQGLRSSEDASMQQFQLFERVLKLVEKMEAKGSETPEPSSPALEEIEAIRSAISENELGWAFDAAQKLLQGRNRRRLEKELIHFRYRHRYQQDLQNRGELRAEEESRFYNQLISNFISWVNKLEHELFEFADPPPTFSLLSDEQQQRVMEAQWAISSNDLDIAFKQLMQGRRAMPESHWEDLQNLNFEYQKLERKIQLATLPNEEIIIASNQLVMQLLDWLEAWVKREAEEQLKQEEVPQSRNEPVPKESVYALGNEGVFREYEDYRMLQESQGLPYSFAVVQGDEAVMPELLSQRIIWEFGRNVRVSDGEKTLGLEVPQGKGLQDTQRRLLYQLGSILQDQPARNLADLLLSGENRHLNLRLYVRSSNWEDYLVELSYQFFQETQRLERELQGKNLRVDWLFEIIYTSDNRNTISKLFSVGSSPKQRIQEQLQRFPEVKVLPELSPLTYSDLEAWFQNHLPRFNLDAYFEKKSSYYQVDVVPQLRSLIEEANN